MKFVGIRLNINGEVYNACMPDGSIHAIMIGYENDIDFYLRGSSIGQKMTWYKSALKNGETFTLEISEMEKSSSPLEMKEYTNEELLDQYALLKQELEGK